MKQNSTDKDDLSKMLNIAKKGSWTPLNEPAHSTKKELSATLAEIKDISKDTPPQPSPTQQPSNPANSSSKLNQTTAPIPTQANFAQPSSTPLSGQGQLSALQLALAKQQQTTNQEAWQKVQTFSNPELMQILANMPKGDEILFDNVAKEASRRKLAAPLQQVFLDVLLNTTSVNTPSLAIRRSLGRASAGQSSALTRHQFGQWTSPYAEYALLASCAEANDRNLATSALWYLASRPLRNKPTQNSASQGQKTFLAAKNPLCTSPLPPSIEGSYPSPDIGTDP